MEETIKLKCEKCGCDYEKPSVFKEYLVVTKHNVFYKWSLAFCDKCRREKERESLKALPDVLRALGENLKLEYNDRSIAVRCGNKSSNVELKTKVKYEKYS